MPVEMRYDKMILFDRQFSMANRWTFLIKPIKRLLDDEVSGAALWIDPFAGMYSPARITNDLNTEMPTNYHMDAIDFLRKFKDESVDGILYDPPYSQRQVKECYEGIGGNIRWDGRMTFWSESKNECARILKPGGKAICFGWNSMGLGKNRGFEMTRILMVTHGGSRNDTICTVEIKGGPCAENGGTV